MVSSLHMCVAGFNTTQRGLWAKHSNEEAAAAAVKAAVKAVTSALSDAEGESDESGDAELVADLPGIEDTVSGHEHGEDKNDSFLDVGSPNRCVLVFFLKLLEQ